MLAAPLDMRFSTERPPGMMSLPVAVMVIGVLVPVMMKVTGPSATTPPRICMPWLTLTVTPASSVSQKPASTSSA